MEIRTRSDFGEFLKERGMLDHAAEVGVAEGRYSLEILQWGVTKLYLVDLWSHVPGASGDLGMVTAEHDTKLQDCIDRIAPYRDRVTILRGWAHEMAEKIPDASLGFVHLDATHEYDDVLRDLEVYWPKLRSGGIMSGHDYLAPQYTVRPAVDDFAAQHEVQVHVIDVDRINDACFGMEKP